MGPHRKHSDTHANKQTNSRRGDGTVSCGNYASWYPVARTCVMIDQGYYDPVFGCMTYKERCERFGLEWSNDNWQKEFACYRKNLSVL